MATATLNTNSLGVTGAELTITTESLITLFVAAKTGSHNNHRVMLQVSPDAGTTWLNSPHSILGAGCYVVSLACTKVRAKVVEIEGATSTVDVWILAK